MLLLSQVYVFFPILDVKETSLLIVDLFTIVMHVLISVKNKLVLLC